MRIHSQDKRYVIDVCAFEAFLKEQGFTEQEIRELIVHLRIIHPKDPSSYGKFKKPSTIYVYTHGGKLREVNDTLLHEAYHYWQEHQATIELALRRKAYEQMRKGWKKEHFFYTYLCWGDTTKRETEIAYWDRPSEVAARAFAEQHAHHQFVSYQQLYTVRVRRNRLLPVQVDLLLTQTKRLGCTEDERDLCFSRLTLKEAESLIRFLEPLGLHFTIPQK